MTQLVMLSYNETARLDPANLETLYRQLGQAGAENVICRAMEELAVRLSDLAPLHRAGRLAELTRLSHSLIGIAAQVGLSTLARVAGDVSECAARSDRVALSATLCRLERIGDRSLTAVWDLQDMSI